MAIVEQKVEFQSQGTTCRGLFVKPSGDREAPLIVLAHGLGGVYEMRLDAIARRFAQAGYAALTFDYRFFGRSDGATRHLLIRKEQQRDIDAAIEFGKRLPGVDGSRLVLWGTSLAGGHMIDVTSARHDVAATIIQCPFTDGLASAGATSLVSALGIAPFYVADVLSRLVRKRPVLVPLAAPPRLPGMMTQPDVITGVLALMPEGTRLSRQLSILYRRYAEQHVKLPAHVTPSELADTAMGSDWVGSLVLPSGTELLNGVSANFGLDIVFWRPGKKLKTLRSPMLVCVCENDSVAPPQPTIAYAAASPMCELKVFPFQHFEIYSGEPGDAVFAAQLAYLERMVPVRTEPSPGSSR